MNLPVLISLFVGLFCITLANSLPRNAFDIRNAGVVTEIQKELARIMALGVAERFVKESITRSGNSRVPVLPELPDPYNPDDTHIEFPNEGITGEIYFCNSTTTGLSRLSDNFRVLNAGEGTLRVLYELNTETVSTSGLQTTNVNIPDQSISFSSGFGDYDLTLVDGFVALEFHIELNIVDQEINLLNFTVDLGFEALTVNFAGAIFNEDPVDWDSVNSDIKLLFEEYWPSIKYNLEEFFEAVFKFLFQNCTISELIQLDFSCIGTTIKKLQLESETKSGDLFKLSKAETCPAEQFNSTTPVVSSTNNGESPPPTPVISISSTTGESPSPTQPGSDTTPSSGSIPTTTEDPDSTTGGSGVLELSMWTLLLINVLALCYLL